MAYSRRSKSQPISQTATGLFAVAGLIAAAYLNSITLQVEFGNTVNGILCGITEFLDCNKAAQSPYAKNLGIPIVIFGIAFYSAITALVTLTTPNHDYKHPFSSSALTQTLFGFAAFYSVFLFIISIKTLNSLCPFCALLYIVNILGFISSWMWNGQNPVATLFNQLRNIPRLFKIWGTTVFIVVFIAALLLSMSVRQFTIHKRKAEYARVEAGKSPTKPLTDSQFRASHSPGLGPVDAPVVIVEFSSFTCPHCANFSKTLKKVTEKYPKQVRVEFRNLPLPHPDSLTAAKAGVCAQEQGKFWPLHDQMFLHASELSIADIMAYAGNVGLDSHALLTCMGSEKSQELIDLDVAAAKKLNIYGAPTFFLNGQIFEGALDYDNLVRRIEAEL